MIRTALLFLLLSLPAATWAQATSRVAKRVLRADAAELRERLANTSFEEAAPETGVAGWHGWQKGFQVSDQARTGKRAARCVSADPEQQFGAGQRVDLHQRLPLPLIAGGWSRAVEVEGSPDSGYSIYVDLAYQDGTQLWGQVAPFSTGTHDWEYREITIIPEKPVAWLIIYGLFRGHRGIAFFDDFSLKELDLPGGARVFDGTPVAEQRASSPVDAERSLTAEAPGGARLRVDQQDGRMQLNGRFALDGRPGGLLLRDVAANSDFLQPALAAVREGDTVHLRGRCPELQVEVNASLRPLGEALRLDGKVTDLTGADRAVTVCWTLPIDLVGGEWPDDMRHRRPIEAGQTYGNFLAVGAGANGLMSRYPLAAPSAGDRRLALAIPLDQPRVARLAYDAGSRELYAAFDLGLTPATTKFPSQATFSALIYDFDPAWGFRSALQRYYQLFPAFFEKRVTREGIWMPFTDIATVERPESFGFQFKEGNDNVPWDEAHGIDTFAYVEPMSYWMPLPPETPRTYQAALAQLEAEQADPRHPRYREAQATRSSAIYTDTGRLSCHLIAAPWNDGALFILNPDPDLGRGDASLTQAEHCQAIIEGAFEAAGRLPMPGWRQWGLGFDQAPGEGREGRDAIVVHAPQPSARGASQAILLNQQHPRPIVASAWSRAEGVTGEADYDYSLYLDLLHTDGSQTWAQATPFATGTHDWQRVEVRIVPDKPIHTVALHLLFRGNHAGTAWFDDVSLLEEGRDEERVANPSFDTPADHPAPSSLDGVYLDSLSMAGFTPNFRREHWAACDEPLTFSLATRQVCSLVMWHTYEFARYWSRRLHEQGKLLMANAVLNDVAFPAHVLDVMGVETNWAWEGAYHPNSDEVFNFRRALCYQKPYLLLLNTDYHAFRPEWVDLYFQRCLFYGVFPSFFSHNAADDPYWQNPALYNRDRPLFERVIPVIQTISAAGWEPVTLARSDNPSVYMERYGRGQEGALYFTLYNPTDQPQAFVATLDREQLGMVDTPLPQVVFAGAACTIQVAGDAWKGQLGPQQALCLRVR